MKIHFSYLVGRVIRKPCLVHHSTKCTHDQKLRKKAGFSRALCISSQSFILKKRGKKEEKETFSSEERCDFEVALLSRGQKDVGRQVSFLSSRLLCPRFHLSRTIVARRWFKRLRAEMIFRNLLAFSSVIASLYDTEERSFWGRIHLFLHFPPSPKLSLLESC